MNSGFAFNQAPATNEHFIVGDFIVVDTSKEHLEVSVEPKMRMHLDGSSTIGSAGVQEVKSEGGIRFDERFLLKEDYDFTAQHLEVRAPSNYLSISTLCLILSNPTRRIYTALRLCIAS